MTSEHANDEPDDAAAVRAEVRSWLEARWPADDRRAFAEDVIDGGWAAPSWPADCFGRGLPMRLSRIVAEEFARAGAPGAGQDATNLWANTVVAFGSDDM